MAFTFDERAFVSEPSVRVGESQSFDASARFGFDLGTTMNAEGKPFYFSAEVPEGNYRVTIEFGHDERASRTTVKSESRRLMLEEIEAEPGESVWRSIVVNVRDDQLMGPPPFAPGGRSVVLNDRETGKLVWDNKLTLEFNGKAPAVRSLKIASVEVPTVFLIGDSTVSDQRYEPAASWGQMLPRFFRDTVAVANHAESGETMKSFISALRLAKVLELIKAGDYLFIQFAHNDQKKQWPQTYVEAATTYKAYLKVLIEEARVRGVTPVLVTSVQRRRFDAEGRIIDSLEDYPEAMREVAREAGVHLIDLEVMSIELYETLGLERAPLAFSKGGKDATHHNNYGAYQIAKCVVQSVIDMDLPLSDAVVDDFGSYDPTKPDDVDTFDLSPSPLQSEQDPLGN